PDRLVGKRETAAAQSDAGRRGKNQPDRSFRGRIGSLEHAPDLSRPALRQGKGEPGLLRSQREIRRSGWALLFLCCAAALWMGGRWMLRHPASSPGLTDVKSPPAPPFMKMRWSWRGQHAGKIENALVISGADVFVADLNGNLSAVDLATGKPRWTYSCEGGFAASPLILDGKILLGNIGDDDI